MTEEEEKAKFVMLVYQGSTPLPGSDRWNALSEQEQKAIHADYADFNKTAGIEAGFPWACRAPSERCGLSPRCRNGEGQA